MSAALGLSTAFLVSPEDLEDGSGVLVLLALCVANLSRILAAGCVGIALARYITSVGVVLIIVFAAVASDLFSVFAGPTRVLVQEDSPVLDGLLLIFPTFGSALGFGLGVSDFIFWPFSSQRAVSWISATRRPCSESASPRSLP